MTCTFRARWRQQAVDWLRADVTAYGKLLADGTPQERELARQRLEWWPRDKDRAAIRDKDALAKLPAEERTVYNKLWTEFEALLKKAQQGPK
jgi:hypothetical protein